MLVSLSPEPSSPEGTSRATPSRSGSSSAICRRLTDATMGRKHLEPAVFEAVDIDENGISCAHRSDPFTDLLAADFPSFLDADAKNPDLVAHGRGSGDRSGGGDGT